MNALLKTNFQFPGQTATYTGKVRDVYTIAGKYLVMIATDRLSAFDVVLPRGIPYKGQLLNQIAAQFLAATDDIVPNWRIASPDPVATVGHRCEPIALEIIVRGYLSGSAWRAYRDGAREMGGLVLPDGLREHEPLPEPVITPTTKAEQGLHDEAISRDEIIARRIVGNDDYTLLERYALALFRRGAEMAARRGLLLVDTKYEFGKKDGKIYLIDEIHTPDSSRYFYADGFAERLAKGLPQKQLSKEFVREWLLENGFCGQPGQALPEMTDEVVAGITDRYIELYEKLTGSVFVREPYPENMYERIETNVGNLLARLP